MPVRDGRRAWWVRDHHRVYRPVRDGHRRDISISKIKVPLLTGNVNHLLVGASYHEAKKAPWAGD